MVKLVLKWQIGGTENRAVDAVVLRHHRLFAVQDGAEELVCYHDAVNGGWYGAGGGMRVEPEILSSDLHLLAGERVLDTTEGRYSFFAFKDERATTYLHRERGRQNLLCLDPPRDGERMWETIEPHNERYAELLVCDAAYLSVPAPPIIRPGALSRPSGLAERLA